MIKRTHPGDLVMHSVGMPSSVTVAEPEMEVDVQGSDPEPEHADDLADFDEFLEEANENSGDTRQAVLPFHLGFLIDHAEESFSTQGNSPS